MDKKAVLLINLGSPKSPSVWHVALYLRQFLMDYRVIDIPFFFRFILVCLIIVPFRSFKSAKEYRKIWSSDGFPLLFYTKKLSVSLKKELGTGYDVYWAMRYQSPSIKTVVESMKSKGYDEIVVVPLFPQYASSTSGSAIEETMKRFATWPSFPKLKIVNHFYLSEDFIHSWKSQAEQYNLDDYDHVLFSFHGLPIRHLHKTTSCSDCNMVDCKNVLLMSKKNCYYAACHCTAREIASAGGVDGDSYSVCFQSRFSKEWLEPFADEELKRLAKEGKKKVLVFSPSFVADCLETIVEIGQEYKEEYFKLCGGELTLVEGLNDSDVWVKALKDVILKS